MNKPISADLTAAGNVRRRVLQSCCRDTVGHIKHVNFVEGYRFDVIGKKTLVYRFVLLDHTKLFTKPLWSVMKLPEFRSTAS